MIAPRPEPAPDALLTPEEVADAMGVTVRTIERWRRYPKDHDDYFPPPDYVRNRRVVLWLWSTVKPLTPVERAKTWRHSPTLGDTKLTEQKPQIRSAVVLELRADQPQRAQTRRQKRKSSDDAPVKRPRKRPSDPPALPSHLSSLPSIPRASRATRQRNYQAAKLPPDAGASPRVSP